MAAKNNSQIDFSSSNAVSYPEFHWEGRKFIKKVRMKQASMVMVKSASINQQGHPK
jgi:hypothetical protein